MSNKINGSGPSWGAVIILLFVFWPVGLYLLIKKLSSDKAAAISSGGKGLKIAGIVMIVFAAVGALGFLSSAIDYGVTSDDIGGLVFLLFFAAGGAALLRKAKNIKKEAESIKEYLAIIVNGGVRQLDTIASTAGKTYEVVRKDIKNMIDKGYLKNAYIDESIREVILSSGAPIAPQSTTNTASSAPVKTKIVVCPCCGANNTISGDLGECEYCGSPLK